MKSGLEKKETVVGRGGYISYEPSSKYASSPKRDLIVLCQG